MDATPLGLPGEKMCRGYSRSQGSTNPGLNSTSPLGLAFPNANGVPQLSEGLEQPWVWVTRTPPPHTRPASPLGLAFPNANGVPQLSEGLEQPWVWVTRTPPPHTRPASSLGLAFPNANGVPQLSEGLEQPWVSCAPTPHAQPATPTRLCPLSHGLERGLDATPLGLMHDECMVG